MELKRCKVVMLPTNEKAKLGYIEYFEGYETFQICKSLSTLGILSHLYILSNDDLNIDDWSLSTYSVEPFQIEDELHLEKNCKFANNHQKSKFYKIIATTNPSLNLPKPSKSFIEKYCELDGIDEVLVEYEPVIMYDSKIDYYNDNSYIINRPKVKNNTITIKPIPKESYTEEDVIKLMELAWFNCYYKQKGIVATCPDFNKWFNQEKPLNK